MTKYEIEEIIAATSAMVHELREYGRDVPLPWFVEDDMLWLLCESRQGVQYKKPICRLAKDHAATEPSK